MDKPEKIKKTTSIPTRIPSVKTPTSKACHSSLAAEVGEEACAAARRRRCTMSVDRSLFIRPHERPSSLALKSKKASSSLVVSIGSPSLALPSRPSSRIPLSNVSSPLTPSLEWHYSSTEEQSSSRSPEKRTLSSTSVEWLPFLLSEGKSSSDSPGVDWPSTTSQSGGRGSSQAISSGDEVAPTIKSVEENRQSIAPESLKSPNLTALLEKPVSVVPDEVLTSNEQEDAPLDHDEVATQPSSQDAKELFRTVEEIRSESESEEGGSRRQLKERDETALRQSIFRALVLLPSAAASVVTGNRSSENILPAVDSPRLVTIPTESSAPISSDSTSPRDGATSSSRTESPHVSDVDQVSTRRENVHPAYETIHPSTRAPFAASFIGSKSKLRSLVDIYVDMADENPPANLWEFYFMVKECRLEKIEHFTPEETRDVLILFSFCLLYNLFMLKSRKEILISDKELSNMSNHISKINKRLFKFRRSQAIKAEDRKRNIRITSCINELLTFLKGRQPCYDHLRDVMTPELTRDDEKPQKGFFYHSALFRQFPQNDLCFLYKLHRIMSESRSINNIVELGLKLILNEKGKKKVATTEPDDDPFHCMTFHDLSREVIDIYLHALRASMLLSVGEDLFLSDQLTFESRELCHVLDVATEALVTNIYGNENFFFAVMRRHETIRNFCINVFSFKRENVFSNSRPISNLWQKLLSFSSPNDLKRAVLNQLCCICHSENAVAENAFTIFDNCEHIICNNCRDFLIRGNECPACKVHVTSYTTFSAYRRYYHARLQPSMYEKTANNVLQFQFKRKDGKTVKPVRPRRYEDERAEEGLIGRVRIDPLLRRNWQEAVRLPRRIGPRTPPEGSQSPPDARRGSQSPPAARRDSQLPPAARRDSQSPPAARRGSQSPPSPPAARRGSQSPPAARRGSQSPPAARRGSQSPPAARRSTSPSCPTSPARKIEKLLPATPPSRQALISSLASPAHRPKVNSKLEPLSGAKIKVLSTFGFSRRISPVSRRRRISRIDEDEDVSSRRTLSGEWVRVLEQRVRMQEREVLEERMQVQEVLLKREVLEERVQVQEREERVQEGEVLEERMQVLEEQVQKRKVLEEGMQVLEREGRVQEREGRVQEREGRVQEREGRVQEREGRVQEREERMMVALKEQVEVQWRIQMRTSIWAHYSTCSNPRTE
ncbi:uncharacterized protein LOC108664851 [Hyalella azteca]|uniref:Uncharacterized protein LOC108664851 n=1 Tax=Hyalella azteca TaxID=294128 RepID=A0A8B7MZM8_HYAAZ|nr:uncharacterized protein LOC108664851 [Hyalella azteca]